MTDRLANDATDSLKGTFFQLHVALEKCFELQPGQKVIIERFGDVTVSGDSQIETKRYEEPLTDNHPNFWNTLKNWMIPPFDPTRYRSLVLLTTQPFGVRSMLASWNTANASDRLKILQAIASGSETRLAKKESGNDEVPEATEHQRFVLDTTRSELLQKVITRISIDALAPATDEIVQRIGNLYCKGILPGKRLDFIGALLAFIIRPIETMSWEIAQEDFEKKYRELSALHAQGTRVFPSTTIDGVPSALDEHMNSLFVKKIREIDYEKVVPDAVTDYMKASKTLIEELKKYDVHPSLTERFKEEVLGVFQPRYRVACRTCTNLIPHSQTFYDERMAETPPRFETFDSVPMYFRNGILHMLLDDSELGLSWRLTPNE